MELVTGRAGTPHITSQQDRQRNQRTFGDGAYILKTGNQLAPVVQSSNKIQIKDGALMFQGALFSVKVGTVDEVTIANGSQGMQRKDLIVARYTYDAGENVESAAWAVIQGTPAASNPVTPEYTEGDIQAGDTTVECPVFIVTLDGINITGVEMVPEIAPDVPEIMAQLEELNSKSEVSKQGITWTIKEYAEGRFEAFGTYSGYVSRSDTYEIDVPLPFTVQSVTGALVNASLHAYYLQKWYINEPQTHSKDNLSLVFVTQNISAQTDFKFDIYCQGIK